MNTVPINRFDRRKRITRALLMHTATELILEKGYEAMTIQDITDRADLGRGTFYVHFKDKEEIVWTFLRENFDTLRQKVETQTAKETGRVRIYLLWKTAFEYVNDHRDLLQIAIGRNSNASLSHRIQDYFVDITITNLEQGVLKTDLSLPPIPIHVMAQFVTGAMMRLILWWLENENTYSPQDMTELFYQLVLKQKPPIT